MIVALVGVVALPVAGQAQSDISGPWEVTIDSPQGAMMIDADFKQAGEDVTGLITSPMGSVEIKGKLVNDALTFSYTVPMQGQNLEINMAGKVAGETMDGMVTIVGLGEVPWKAKRKAAGAAAAAAAPAAPAAAPAASAGAAATGDGVSGKWDVLMETPGGQMPFTATFAQAGEKVTGTIEGPGGEIPIAGTLTGSALKLEMNVPTPQGDLAITMTGDLSPTGLTGKASTMMGDMTWSATRVKQ
jgi:hypothetical protein